MQIYANFSFFYIYLFYLRIEIGDLKLQIAATAAGPY